MRRTLTAVAGVLVLLAGCSSSSTSTAPSTSTSAGSSGTTAPAPSDPGAAPGEPDATSNEPVTVPPTTLAPRPATIAALLALGRPIVLAHTGGEDQFPGSTMYSFGESMLAGVDVLDINVQLTSDGVLVIQHDDTVDRTSNGTGNVGDLTYAQVAALDNAYWFSAECTCTGQADGAYVYRGVRTGAVPPPAGYTPDDFAVPRFSDLVARYPDVPLNIEIKGTGAPAAAAATELAKELHDLSRASAAVVTSFDDPTVTLFHQIAPDVVVSPGLVASAAWVLSGSPLPDGMTILQLPPTFDGLEVITPASIAAAHAAGYVIWVWPNDRALENRDSYAAFLQEGIDGLNINFPGDGVAAVKAFVPSP